VAFPLDASVRQGYSRLLEFINKNKPLQVFNGVPPPDSLNDEKIVAILGNRGTQAHTNKYEMCFEYSSFKPMFTKRDVIECFLVEGDEVSIEAYGGTTSSRAAAHAAAAKRARGSVPGVSTLPEWPLLFVQRSP
jgi:hypothetical protein